jgi:hypothetical protein
MEMKAFYINTKDGHFPSVVLSKNKGQAKYAMFRGAKDSGFKYKFADFVCRRLPSHDELANPMPCSRMYPINRPTILDTVDNLISQACGCSKCNAPNAQITGPKAPVH